MKSAVKLKIPFPRYPSVACWCFIFSGAASISYQMIWLRQAMTHFGVITPVISSVLSVFMLGLAIGTVVFAKFTQRINNQQTLGFYILAEGLIALFALLVPVFFEEGYKALLGVQYSDSTNYLFFSWLIITLALLPVCTLIGATLPLIMKFIRGATQDKNNFGLLYFANLAGGILGCLLPLFSIELYGFNKTLWFTAGSNVVAAVLALSMYLHYAKFGAIQFISPDSALVLPQLTLQHKLTLFLTGLVALGSEVIWIKLFMPATGNSVYAFAAILTVYLLCNFLGAFIYLSRSSHKHWIRWMTVLLPLATLVPFLAVAVQPKEILTALGIAPLCFLLGYITPYIIDTACKNHPLQTGYAYFYNLLGCIVGPLITTYILFPAFGLKGTLIIYAAIIACVPFLLGGVGGWRKPVAAVMWCVALCASFMVKGPEERISQNGELYRDYTGYIGAVGKGMKKRLIVNGISMTRLTTITKNMAHLPMQYFPEAKSALVICFGMGTTVRSLVTWPLERIAVVELSEGVINTFPYFYKNAKEVLNDPRVQIIVDDGRRYLNRAQNRYDVITIDPPPPVYTSGSSLLYSTEFYAIAKSRLSPDGVLAQWLPPTDAVRLKQAVFQSIKKNFKHVIVYKGIKSQGMHFIASDRELPPLSPQEFVEKLPQKAHTDLLQWKKHSDINIVARNTVKNIPIDTLLSVDDNTLMVSDDMPYNEFYLFRRWDLD